MRACESAVGKRRRSAAPAGLGEHALRRVVLKPGATGAASQRAVAALDEGGWRRRLAGLTVEGLRPR